LSRSEFKWNKAENTENNAKHFATVCHGRCVACNQKQKNKNSDMFTKVHASQTFVSKVLACVTPTETRTSIGSTDTQPVLRHKCLMSANPTVANCGQYGACKEYALSKRPLLVRRDVAQWRYALVARIAYASYELVQVVVCQTRIVAPKKLIDKIVQALH
jgi:hypothetical protein